MRRNIPKVRNFAPNNDLEVVVSATESVFISRYFILCVVLKVETTDLVEGSSEIFIALWNSLVAPVVIADH